MSSAIAEAKMAKAGESELKTLRSLKSDVYEAQLRCDSFKACQNIWIDYLTFLHAENKHLEAKAVKSRALQSCTQKDKLLSLTLL